MNRSNLTLFKISRVVYNETYLEAYLEINGQQKENFIKKLKKNKRSVRNQSIVTKIISSVMIFLLAYLPAQMIGSFYDALEGSLIVNEIAFNSLLYSLSVASTMCMILQLVFLFTYGMTSVAGIFNVKSFKYLETLPFTSTEIRKIVFFSFLRTLDLQFLCIFLSLPIITIIYTSNILAILVSFVVSGLHLMFCISFIILISHFFAKKVFTLDTVSKFKTFLRIISTLGTLLGGVTAGLMINVIVGNITIPEFLIYNSGDANSWLSIIVYPFTLSYVYAISLFPSNSYNFNQIISILLAFIVSIVLIVGLFNKAFKKLRTASKETVTESSSRAIPIDEKFELEKLTSVNSIVKKDIKFITRDFQVLMSTLVPILMPIMGIFIAGIGEDIGSRAIMMSFILNAIYMGMSIIFLIRVVTSAESETGNLLYSLPIRNYDIYKAKKRIIISVMFLSTILPTIFLFLSVSIEGYLTILISTLGIYVMIFYCAEYILLIFALLFGKIRNKYTFQILNPRMKALKTTLAGILLYVLIILPIIIMAILSDNFEMQSELEYSFVLVIAIIIYIPIKFASIKIFKRD